MKSDRISMDGCTSLTLIEAQAMFAACGLCFDHPALCGKDRAAVIRAMEKLDRSIRLSTRDQEGPILAARKAEEERIVATTCFHCGYPALPETHGFDPRCERHRDV